MTRHATQDDASLLAEMRAHLEAAAGEIDRLASELAVREEWVDELESIADVALGLVDTPVVVVGGDRRVRAVSRGASGRLGGGVVVGKPLSSVVADEVFAAVDARLSAAARGRDEVDEPGAPPAAPADVEVQPLPGGGAIVVFEGG